MIEELLGRSATSTESPRGNQINVPKLNPVTANEYSEFYESVLSLPYRKELKSLTLEKLLSYVSRLRIVEFVCGEDVIIQWLKERRAKCIVGYNITEYIINYAYRHAEKKRIGINYIVINYTSNIDGKYNVYLDIIFVIYIIPDETQLEDLLEIFQIIARELKLAKQLLTLPTFPDFNSIPEYYRSFDLYLLEKLLHTDVSPAWFSICSPYYSINISASTQPANLFLYVKYSHALIIECIKGTIC